METTFLCNWIKRIHGRPLPLPKWWCAVFVCLACLAGNVFADQSQIVVKPEVTNELLKNPGMGWETFSNLKKDYPLPVYALGGMQYSELQNAWQTGAHGIAMQRAVWE